MTCDPRVVTSNRIGEKTVEKNPYEILGVESGCDEETLKKAYKQKCFEFHPDKFATESPEKQKEAEEKFKEVQKAFNSIKDGSYEASRNQHEGFGIGDFFTDIFSRFTGNRESRQRNISIEIPEPIQITFVEAIAGCTKHINFQFELGCAPCGGQGVVPTPNSCKNCNGKGSATVDKKSPFGLFRQTTTCEVCGGSGKEMTKCSECTGNGSIRHSLKEDLKFEPCNPTSKKLNRKIQDIDYTFLVKVQTVLPENLKIEMFNNERILAINYEVSITDFLLGGNFSLDIGDGCGEFNFQTKLGDNFILVDKKGIPHRGDRLPLKINILQKIPQTLSDEQKEILNNLKKVGL